MMPFFSTRFTLRMVASVLVIVLAGAFLASCSTAPSGTSSASATAQQVPALPGSQPEFAGFVDPSVDLGAQNPGPEQSWVDSIYITGRIQSGTHRFGILVHTLTIPHQDQRIFIFAVTDETAGSYQETAVPVPATQYHWDHGVLNIHLPGLTWTGDAHRMSVVASMVWGTLNAVFLAQGPVLKYAGTGYIPLLGTPNYEYAFPSLRTTGTLTMKGKLYDVSGQSWLDRQWGPTPFSPHMRWTWMNMSLSNGDKVGVWNALDGQSEDSWATVLHPNGSYELATVTPLAANASRPWTSPTSHNVYPTSWHVKIPEFQADLSVTITGPLGQEPQQHYEGTAAITGTYKGEVVTGQTYVEMVGNWS